MNYFKYLKDHAGWTVIWLFLVTTTEIMFLTLKGSLTAMIIVGVIITASIVVGTFADYFKVKRFMSSLEKSVKDLDKKYLLPEMIDSARSFEEEIYIRILREMEQSMADNVADYRRRSEEYREYIETWVHEVKIPIATAEMIIANHALEPLKSTGIDSEIGRIQNYVEQALFFARSEAVEKDYFIKHVDLEETVNSVIYGKKKMLREKKTSVDIHDMEVSKPVLSDAKWLAFIMSQIIDNSCKYAKEDTGLQLEIFVTEANDKVCLHLRDNGIGIKPMEKNRIFDKGFTGTNGRNVSASTGMGLYLCKKLCSRLEHDLEVESEENVGTDIMIIF